MILGCKQERLSQPGEQWEWPQASLRELKVIPTCLEFETKNLKFKAKTQSLKFKVSKLQSIKALHLSKAAYGMLSYIVLCAVS